MGQRSAAENVEKRGCWASAAAVT